MKTKLSFYISAFLFLALIAGLTIPMQAARAATICVNPGGTDGCFATIQAAIDAVTTTDGDTINVAAGTYPEAVVINKSLNLIGAGIGLSVIQAPASLPAATSLDSAVVSILGGSVNAEITGFTIAGPGPSACGSIKAGVFVRGSADANIHHNRIQDIRDNSYPVSGCQNGIGIVVGRNADATVGTATIANNEIVTYQKGGIVVDGTGSNADITGNTVTGIGTTTITAQNGIQISRGATATLLGNSITGNSFHLDGSPWDWGAAGILLYQSGSVTMSGGNAISGNDQNLYIDSATAVSFGAEAFGPSSAPLDFGYNVINLTTLNLNLTNVTYPGSVDNYNIEDRIWHAIDDPTVGLVASVAGNLYVTPLSGTIQRAIGLAAPGDTINVAAGTYLETGQIVINKNLTIIGADKTTTIIKPAQDTGVSGDDRGWFLVNSGVTFNLSKVTLDGDGRLVNIAINSHGSGTVNNNIIQNMGYNPSGPDYAGRAIALWDANMTVSNNTIQNFGRIGIYVGSGVTAAVIDGNTITGKGSGNHLDYGVELGRGGVAEVKNNTISNCRGVAIDGSTSAAMLVTTYFNPGTSANVHDNIFSNNTAGIVVGYDAFDTSSVTAHHNQFLGNDEGISSTAPVVNAENNWWGVTSGPATGVIIGNVDFTPWCADSACTSLPPEMPSSFLGTIYNPAFAGRAIEAYIADSLITSVAITGTGPLTYSFDVPSDLLGTLPTREGGVEGDVITFKINGVVVGTGIWHSGTNVELNFATVSLSDLSQVYNGLPKSAAFTTNPTGLMVNLTYNGSSVVPTNAGSYAVVANITTPKYAGMASGTLVIAKASSTTTLSGGGTFVYNGLSRSATVSVTGAGGLNQTPSPVYSGSCIAAPVNVLDTPCAAGYSFAGDANHEASTGSTNIFITPAAGTVSLGNLSQIFTGSPRSASYTTIPAGLSVDITYEGSATAPTNAGSYTVVATINDPNSAAGTASGTLVIGKATATLTLSNLTQANNGTPRSAMVTTVPAGLNFEITYNGSATAPTNAGSYAVIATVNDLNYAGTASGTLVITPATHSIALVPGWNLISFNLSPTNTAVTNVLSSVAGKYNLVYAWDASVSTNNWKKYDPTAPFGNTLVNLDEKMGFWIHMTTVGTLDVVGNVPAATTINLSTTAGGWNLVAYPSANGSLSPASIGGGNVALVYAYHANDVSDPWKLYDQSAPSWSNDLTVLAPGWGYWVKVIAPQTWNVPY